MREQVFVVRECMECNEPSQLHAMQMRELSHDRRCNCLLGVTARSVCSNAIEIEQRFRARQIVLFR